MSEHVTVGCVIHDEADGGVRLTLLDASSVPSPFLLIADGYQPYQVCTVSWRTEEEIGARFSARRMAAGSRIEDDADPRGEGRAE